MPRSVNNVASRERRKKTLKLAKGYFGRRKNVWTVAKNAVEKGLTYAYRDRRAKKREFRALWIVRINAACREQGVSYSQFMGKLSNSDLNINRKVLADLAMNDPQAFKAVFDQVMSAKPKAKAETKTESKAKPVVEAKAEIAEESKDNAKTKPAVKAEKTAVEKPAAKKTAKAAKVEVEKTETTEVTAEAEVEKSEDSPEAETGN